MKAGYRLNTQTKKNLKLIETTFVSSGFEAKDSKALARMYYKALSNKTARQQALAKLDEVEPDIIDDPMDELDDNAS